MLVIYHPFVAVGLFKGTAVISMLPMAAVKAIMVFKIIYFIKILMIKWQSAHFLHLKKYQMKTPILCIFQILKQIFLFSTKQQTTTTTFFNFFLNRVINWL